MIFYSESENGFFIEGLHDTIPTDGIALTPEEHMFLLEEQALGKEIVVVDGEVSAIERILVANWDGIRRTRNRLIAATDWTQLSDSPLDEAGKLAWQTYRQALRDITESYSDPNEVVWPTEPA